MYAHKLFLMVKIFIYVYVIGMLRFFQEECEPSKVNNKKRLKKTLL